LLHGLAKIHASFDDPNLVSRAGLVPVMALGQRAGLGELVADRVRPGQACGVNAAVKIRCLVAGMTAGADRNVNGGTTTPTAGLQDQILPPIHGKPSHEFTRWIEAKAAKAIPAR
jgi:hypothetical protein